MHGNLYLAALLGFIVPFIVSYIKNVKWPKFYRIMTALGISVGVAILGLLAQGDLKSFHDVVINASIIWATAQAFYHSTFQGSEFNAELEGAGPFVSSS